MRCNLPGGVASAQGTAHERDRRWLAICALALSYALLGLLMNSVGTVILQSISHFGVSKPRASTLEACKDLAVVAASFLLATRVAAFGYRRALTAAMLLMAAACAAASFAGGFLQMQILFIAIGFTFGAAKIATYASIGLLARDARDHASITGLVEGIFMVGILAGIFIFGWFIAVDPTGRGWLNTYRVIAAGCVAAALLWLIAPLDQPRGAVSLDAKHSGAPSGMLAMLTLPASPTLLACLFLYVFIEQGVGTWLPTFNAQILHLPAAISVQMSSVYVGALALGRLGSGAVLRRFAWKGVLLSCLACLAALVLVSLPLADGAHAAAATGWGNAPVAAFLFPLLGVFLAPIYPTLCSVALSALPPPRQAEMTGLIVIFSALGGTLGSLLTGLLFQRLPGTLAFYLTLVPIALIALLLPILHNRVTRAAAT